MRGAFGLAVNWNSLFPIAARIPNLQQLGTAMEGPQLGCKGLECI